MVRKQGDDRAEESVANAPLTPPSEAWLLRTLAELRREQRYEGRAAQPYRAPRAKGRGVKR